MLPYLPTPQLQLGPLTVDSQGACVALGFVLGLTLWRRRLRTLLPAPGAALAWIAPTCMVAALLGGRALASLASAPLPAHAQGLLQSQSSLGALAGGAVAAWLWSRRLQLRWSALVQSAVGPLLAAWLLVRLGCALAHDHIGRASDHPLAVAFPSGGRFDLGVLEWLALWPIAAGYLLLRRYGRLGEPRRAGAVAVAYAALRAALEPLRQGGGDTALWLANAAIVVALAMLGLWWLWRGSMAEGGGEPRHHR